jgi:hypothetical protein
MSIPNVGPIPDVIDGNDIYATWGNAVGASSLGRVVHRFASTAERDAAIPPGQLVRGMVCVTTDTDTLWQAVGAPPSTWDHVSTGAFVGMASGGNGQAIGTTLANLAGVQVPFTVVAGHRYLVFLFGMVTSGTTVHTQYFIADAASTTLFSAAVTVANGYVTHNLVGIVSPPPGAYTLKGMASAATAATFTLNGNTTIMVLDLGR